ncbi:MAG TPA: polysaccharide deacetylase family protein [Kofleriaceae bacterium]|nr:polysaccharide deacetylase family protein [Kofleriaceae bacterium]
MRKALILIMVAMAPAAARADESKQERQAREIRENGKSYRLVGNKNETRFPTHSYVAFTFDDGPSYQTTPRVMAALEKYDIPATFFVIGNRLRGDKPEVQKNIDVLKDELRRGFQVGNHTLNHLNLKTVGADVLAREIDVSADIIEGVAGYRPYLVRFPYGIMAPAPRAYLDSKGYTEVRWNIDSTDFKLSDREKLRTSTVQQIVDWNGGIVLFHDIKEWTADIIDDVFDDLEAINCRRLKTREPLLLPVSLHYFAREKKGKPRPVPPEVEARTRRYVDNLPARCQARIDKRRASQ